MTIRWTDTARDCVWSRHPEPPQYAYDLAAAYAQLRQGKAAIESARSRDKAVAAELAAAARALTVEPKPAWTARHAALAALVFFGDEALQDHAPSPFSWARCVADILGGRGLMDALDEACHFSVANQAHGAAVERQEAPAAPRATPGFWIASRVHLAWSDPSTYRAARERVASLRKQRAAVWQSLVVPTEAEWVAEDAEAWLSRPVEGAESLWALEGHWLLMSTRELATASRVLARLGEANAIDVEDVEWAYTGLESLGDDAATLLAPYADEPNILRVLLHVDGPAAAGIAARQVDSESPLRRMLAAEHLVASGPSALPHLEDDDTGRRLADIILAAADRAPKAHAERWQQFRSQRPAKLPKKIASLPPWAAPHGLPALHSMGGKRLSPKDRGEVVITLLSGRPTSRREALLEDVVPGELAGFAVELLERWLLFGAPEAGAGLSASLARLRPAEAAMPIARALVATTHDSVPDSAIGERERSRRRLAAMLPHLGEWGAAGIDALSWLSQQDLDSTERNTVRKLLRDTEASGRRAPAVPLAHLPAATRERLLRALDRAIAEDRERMQLELADRVDDAGELAEAWVAREAEGSIADVLSQVSGTADSALVAELRRHYREALSVK